MRHVILIGFMGAGKTTLGRGLAKAGAGTFVDTDDMIVEKMQMTIPEIFRIYGEPRFRELETECLKELLKMETPCVISVGGGLPVKEENRQLFCQLGKVIYLRAKVDTLEKRLSGDTGRPLLAGGDLRRKIIDLMEQREEIYLAAADMIIDTDGKKPADVIREISEKIC